MNLIVNVDSTWGIGREGRLLAHLSADMRRFKHLTVGQVLVLGRKTLETFPGGRPLPDRTNIVLTRSTTLDIPGACVCRSLDELAGRLADVAPERVFAVGGASIYRLLLPFCHLAYVTRMQADLEADAWFPNLDQDPAWRLVESEPVQSGFSRIGDPNQAIDFQFCLYAQKRPADLDQWLRERGERLGLDR
ncbi:MAG: dihydrofolate reductase [Clostridiaceae bacterium]|jgi:dihydrofolate reductase|nr:dihydrofolate reductase [Clostridiaceae bacterium]